MRPYAAIASNNSLCIPLRQTRDVNRMSRTLDDERCMWCTKNKKRRICKAAGVKQIPNKLEIKVVASL